MTYNLSKLKTILLLVSVFFSFIEENSAQTLLIDPNGDGGFENGATLAANGWTVVDETAVTWFVGTAAGSQSGSNSAFVGSNSTTYIGSTSAVVKHFYKDIVIPSGASQVYLNYYLKMPTIDNNYDYFYIFTTTPANTPVSGTIPGVGYTQRVAYTTPALAVFTAMPQIDLTSLAGTTVRLVFTYKSDAISPYANPAVDNISLSYLPPDLNNMSTIFTSSNYFTVPIGVYSVNVECWGGGGGGGGSAGSSDGGGGGGGGAYSKSLNIPVIPNQTYAVNVGYGGYQYSTSDGVKALDGGDSWFKDASTILAKGGTGGYNTNTSTLLPGNGGVGGASASGIGDVKYSGGNGGAGRDNNSGSGGPGGSSAGTAANGTSAPTPWTTTLAAAAPAGGGKGGDGGGVGVSGSNGNLPGGGGGGAGELASGGNGSNGQVIISYTCINISSQPTNQVLCSGGSAEFTVVSSAPLLSYQWQYNGVNVTNGIPAGAVYSGINSSTLIISGAIAAGTYSSYNCVLSNSCGSVTTNAVQLTVNASTAPATPPNPTASSLDCNVTLTATGIPPANVLWYWQGLDCGTKTTLGSGNTFTANTSGNYYIRAYNTIANCWSQSCGSVYASVLDAPTIITQPQNTNGCNGSPVQFNITTTGSGLTYQWQENGVNLANTGVYSGVSTETLTISDPIGLDGKQYRCIVTGNCGSIISNSVILTVIGSSGLSGTKTVGTGGDYTTLKAAFDAINANGLIGNLDLRIISDITDNNEASLNQWNSCGNSGYTVTIYPGGAVRTLSGSVATSLITLNGADKVTFDGRIDKTGAPYSLILSNTNTSGSTIKFINDACYNTLQYCTLQGVSNTATTGVVHFSTATLTGNDYNTIKYCTIKDGASTPKIGIFGLGTFGKENDNNIISYCNIYNFFIANGVGYGIRLIDGNTKWSFIGNSLYQTSNRNAGDFYAIYVVNNLGGEFIIDGNFIGGQSSNCGGAALTYTDGGYSPYFRGIYLYCSTSGLSYIKNNTIKNINFGTSPFSNNDFLFFPIMTAGGRIDITSNIIGDNSSTGSIVLNITDKSTYKSINMAIYKEGDGYVRNNSIGSISITGTSNDACTFYGVQILGTLISDALVTGNIIGSSTVANSIQCAATPPLNFCGILFGTDGNYKTTVSNNIVSNITSNSTGTVPWIMGLDNEASAGTQIIIGNTISNISSVCTNTNGNNASSIVGIASMNTTSPGHTVSDNTICSLTSTGAASVNVFGIICYHATGAATNINNNFIHSIKTTSATAIQTGIKIYSGPGNFSNNMIRLGIDNTGTSIATALIRGIWQYTTDNCNFYFNSVYIGGTASGAVNTYCFKRDQSAATNIKNNIFFNERTGGTGKNFAIVTNTATVISDYNDLFTDVTGTNTASYDGGTTSRTFAAWKIGTSQDASSINTNPLFIDPTSGTPDLHIQAASPAIGVGVAGTGVLVDFDSQQRKTGVNPNGPCIGADERLTVPYGTNAYGIYMPAPQATGNIVDCEIYATGGTPGGQGIKVGNPTATNWANVNISSYQVITEQNIQCMNTNIDFTTASASPSWLMGNGSSPSTGSTSPLTVQYSSTGRKDIIESVKVFKDFTNITMPVPSPGSILGAPSGAGCPTTYNYTSSVAGSPGFTYQWSVVVPGGCSATIANPTASSTDITFVNLTGYNQVFAIYLDITTECCGPLTRVIRYITIYPAPLAPTVTGSPFSICTGGTQAISVNSPDGSYSYGWYNASTGGTLLGNGVTYTVNPVLSGSNNYYVQATNSFGCTSTRTSVTVIGNDEPAPVVPSDYTCGADNITLSVSSPIAGYTYNWYSGSCNGTLLQTGTSTSFTTFVSSTTNFYVSAVPPNCGPSSCATVTATVNAIPNPIIWLGVVGGTNNWFNTSNWTSGCLPTCLGNVRIPSGTPNSPDIGYNAVDNAHCKDLDLQNGATLSFSDAKAELDICGNVTHAGTLTTNSLGLVKFTGSTAQTYSKSGSGNFHNVSLDNSLGLTINSGNMILDATGVFEFNNGKITTGTNFLILNNPDQNSISGYGTGKYVFGNLRRYINSGTFTYAFPVGSSNRYTLAELINTGLTGVTYIDAKFVTPFTNTGTLDPAKAVDFSTVYTSVASEGVWQLDPNANPTGGSYSIKLWFNDGGGANPFTGLTTNMFGPLKRPSGSTLASDWTALGGTLNAASTPGRTVAGGYAQRTGWNTFSQYAIGIAATVLPIELLKFNAFYNGKSVDVLWTTATETNNNYFTIEKSINSYDFDPIGIVYSKALNGNSNSLLNYSFNDIQVKYGIYYYRLKQTDNNGEENYSPIASVFINETDAFSLFPNPAHNIIQIKYFCSADNEAIINIYDDKSSLVLSKKILCTVGLNSETIDVSSLSQGIYFVSLTTNSHIYRTKLIKEK